MNLIGLLLAFAALGLFGAAHCAGMCGGFAALVGARTNVFTSQLAYIVGKAVTYALLGVIVASAGELVAHGGAHLTSDDAEAHARHLALVRAAFAWLAGGTLILFGLRALGLRLPGTSSTGGPGRLLAPLARGFRGLAALPGYAGPLGVGLATGFLPCGLSWSALLLAASTGPLVAGLGLFVFGLATAPALVAAGLGWRFVSAHRRELAARISGPLLIAFGLYTGLRGGLPVPESVASTVLPACCAPESGAD